MPELPEVETICRGLNQATLDREILGGDVLLNSTIARSISATDFLTKLKGKSIARWYRRGKYLLAELSQFPEGERERGRGGEWENLLPKLQTLPERLLSTPPFCLPKLAGWAFTCG